MTSSSHPSCSRKLACLYEPQQLVSPPAMHLVELLLRSDGFERTLVLPCRLPWLCTLESRGIHRSRLVGLPESVSGTHVGNLGLDPTARGWMLLAIMSAADNLGRAAAEVKHCGPERELHNCCLRPQPRLLPRPGQ